MIFKFKVNDNLKAIYDYLAHYEYRVELSDLIQFCFDYEYYKELYENFHIIYQVWVEHNRLYPDPYVPPVIHEDPNLL